MAPLDHAAPHPEMAPAIVHLMHGGLDARAAEPIADDAPSRSALGVEREGDFHATPAGAFQASPFAETVVLDHDQLTGLDFRVSWHAVRDACE
jgi:hypothetical protein